MTRPVLPAMLAAASIALSSIMLPAYAAPIRPPDTDAPRGGIASPGEPFLPGGRRALVPTGYESFAMICELAEGSFANGSSIIKLVNSGDETIPAGATIKVTLADGSKMTFKTASPIKPGAAVSVMGPVGATPEDFGCSTAATALIPITEPGSPNVPSGQTGLPLLPAKLVCTFEIIGGKVVITWTNTGKGSVPAGSMITGKTSTGIGMSSFIEEPIKPGETLSITLDIDPKFFDEACIATFAL
jgi:hypothetical protein